MAKTHRKHDFALKILNVAFARRASENINIYKHWPDTRDSLMI